MINHENSHFIEIRNALYYGLRVGLLATNGDVPVRLSVRNMLVISIESRQMNTVSCSFHYCITSVDCSF